MPETTETKTVTTEKVVATTPAPATAVVTPKAPGSMVYASTGKRVVAAIIDQLLAFFVIGFIVGLLTGGTTSDGFELTGAPAFISFILMLGYFVAMEGMKGQTLGKMFLKLKVVKEDGSAISYQEALIRQVLKVVDGFFFGVVGLVIISKSPLKQRLGDKVAHTVVVEA